MPLNTQSKVLLDQLAALGGKPLEEMTPAEAREDRARAMEAFKALSGPAPEVARVRDRTIPGPAQPVPVRIYWPKSLADHAASPGAAERFPALVYFHGGGWVFGNLDQVDQVCRVLANSAGYVVVSVDYRLAPEHKFPAAAEDAYAAAQFVATHAEELGIDASRIAVAGDSAGGNLAAVVCLMARDRGGPSLMFQLLVYPCTDYHDDRPSMREFAENHLLTRASMRYFWNHYLARPEQGRDPYASPIYAPTLAGLPPALVITAECDPIRDQGEAYAQRLKQAGVAAEVKRYEGVIHAFFQMGAVIDAGKQAVEDAAAALRGAAQLAATA